MNLDKQSFSISIGISAVSAAGDVTNGDSNPSPQKEKNICPKKKQAEEDKRNGVTRVYSNADASGKLYLKRIQTVAESKKQSKMIKYPLAPSFYAASRR